MLDFRTIVLRQETMRIMGALPIKPTKKDLSCLRDYSTVGKVLQEALILFAAHFILCLPFRKIARFIHRYLTGSVTLAKLSRVKKNVL